MPRYPPGGIVIAYSKNAIQVTCMRNTVYWSRVSSSNLGKVYGFANDTLA